MTTITPASPPTAIATLETSIHCLQCGYDLIGLPEDGVCPECGAHVADSTRGTLLHGSAPHYLARLHKGVFIIQATIVASIILAFVLLGVQVTSVSLSGNAAPGTFDIILEVVIQCVSLAGFAFLMYGWWLFSSPDARNFGVDTGDKPRRFVRSALMAVVGAQILNTLMSLILWNMPASTTTNLSMSLIVLFAINLLNLAAQVVLFIASMLYVKWLGRRLPSLKVVNRAKLLVWLGPVLWTVGLLLLGLGPLIALVLYWNLLNWVRKDLKAIRESVGTGARNLTFG